MPKNLRALSKSKYATLVKLYQTFHLKKTIQKKNMIKISIDSSIDFIPHQERSL